MDWTEPALKPIDVVTSTACERRVYKVLAKKNSLALTLLIPSVEHVSPAAAVRAIGGPRRTHRPTSTTRPLPPTEPRARCPAAAERLHLLLLLLLPCLHRTRSRLPRTCSRWRGARWPNPCRTPSPPRPCCRTRPIMDLCCGGWPTGGGAPPCCAGVREVATGLGAPSAVVSFVCTFHQYVCPRGLILDLLPRVLHRRGRRGLAHGPPRSAEPPPSSPGAHLARVHTGQASDALERDRRISSE